MIVFPNLSPCISLSEALKHTEKKQPNPEWKCTGSTNRTSPCKYLPALTLRTIVHGMYQGETERWGEDSRAKSSRSPLQCSVTPQTRSLVPWTSSLQLQQLRVSLLTSDTEGSLYFNVMSFILFDAPVQLTSIFLF